MNTPDDRERTALRGMSEKAIRRAQDMVFQQQEMAFKQGNTKAMTKLNEWERNYADELMRRLMENPNGR